MNFRMYFNRKNLIFIFIALAFIIRLGLITELKNTPVLQIPIADAKTYLISAQKIYDGNLLASETTFTNPFYPYFIATALRVLGFIIPQKYLIISFSQTVITLISIYLIYLITKKIFNEQIALVSCFIISIYRITVFFDSTILSVSLINFLNIYMIYLLFKYDERKKLLFLFYAGLLCGLSSITRGNLIHFVPFVFFWLIISNKNLRTASKRFLIFAAGFVIVISILTIRNYLMTSEFIPISSNFGYNFYVGNNEKADGTYSKPGFIHSTYQYFEEKESEDAAKQLTGSNLTHNEASLYWFKQGINFVLKEPVKSLKLEVKKVFYFFNSTEIANNLSNYAAEEYSLILRILPNNFGIISSLALLGLVIMFKSNFKTVYWLLIFYFITIFLTSLLFWVSSEYRTPVTMILIILAVYYLYHLIKIFKNRQYKLLTFNILLAVVLSIGFNYNVGFLDKFKSPAPDFEAFGNELAVSHNSNEAVEMYLKALESDSSLKYLNYYIASLYLQAGDNETALTYFSRVPHIEDYPDSLKTGFLRVKAKKLFEEKKYLESKDELEKLVKSDTSNFEDLNNLGLCYVELDSLDRAKNIFSEIIRKNPDYYIAYANLGIVYEKLKIIKTSIQFYEKADSLKPSNPQFKLKLIYLYNEIGNNNKVNQFKKELENNYPENSETIKTLKSILKDKE